MADNYVGDAGLSQSHPRIVSVVSNTDEIAQSSGGGLRTFAAVISEKGDESLQLITDSNELIEKLGSLDAKKYGQSAYNIKNWVDSQGEAVVLRILPDNAGFAHSYLNIQSKIGTKKVKNVDGTLVDYDDITLKTTLGVTTNNTSVDLLELDLNKDRSSEISIDGFTTNLLFLVRPTGRGEYYNNLGFRITLNKQFDSVLSSRVYNFEVVEFKENNVINIKEGPFFVSLDPDSLASGSDESLFIDNVINKYSKFIRITSNPTQVLSLAKTINSNVYPYSIDPIFGTSRTINGQLETFYCKATGRNEDVNISIQKYNYTGEPAIDIYGNPVLNYVNCDDSIEKSIVSIDNTYKDNKKLNFEKSIDNMKLAGKLLKTGDYKSVISEGSSSLLSALEASIASPITIANMSTFLDNARKIADLLKALDITEDDLKLNHLTNDISLALSCLNSVEIKNISVLNQISQLQVTLSTGIAQIGTNLTKKIALISSVFTDLTDIYNYLLILNTTPIVYITPANGNVNGQYTDLTALTTAYIALKDKFDIVSEVFASDTDISNAVDSILSENGLFAAIGLFKNNTNTMLTSITTRVQTVLNTAEYIPQVVADLKTLKDQKYTQIPVTADGSIDQTKIQPLLDKVKKNIDSFKNNYAVVYFENTLHSMKDSCKFNGGTEGDLSMDNPNRAEVIKSLLIKAYSGLINDKVTDKRLLPFTCILDANYPTEVKNAIVNLGDNIRKDFIYIADCKLNADVESVLGYRRNEFNVSSNLTAIYGQDIVVYDAFTSRDQKFTMPYLLASKLPTLNNTVGLHQPIAGNRRGVIDGFKSINFIPNDTYQDILYTNRVNYAISDTKRTKLNSQLTSDYKKTPLSDLNNVFTMLNIKRDSEAIVEGYQFELADASTMRSLQQDLNEGLNKYITSRACDLVDAKVYASDYDLKQHILRVSIKIQFKDIIESVIISLEVSR